MVKIAQITDLHLDDFLAEYYQIDARHNLGMVLDHILQNHIDGIVVTGDFGTTQSGEWLLERLASLNLPYEFILGNHDKFEDYTELASLRGKIKPTGLYYTASLGWEEWVFLDSRTGEVNQDQLQWLAEVIRERAGSKNLVVFIHHPILDCGNSAMDRKSPLRNREQVQEILEGFTGEVTVFCGHYHNRHTQKVGNITQHLTPSCLMQIRLDAEEIQLESKGFGYRVIELDEQGVNTWYEKMNGM